MLLTELPITYMSDSKAHETVERLTDPNSPHSDLEWDYRVVCIANNLAYIVIYDEDGELVGTL